MWIFKKYMGCILSLLGKKKIKRSVCYVLIFILVFQNILPSVSALAENAPSSADTQVENLKESSATGTDETEEQKISVSKFESDLSKDSTEHDKKGTDEDAGISLDGTEENIAAEQPFIEITGLAEDVITKKEILSAEEAEKITVPVPEGKEICSVLDIYRIEGKEDSFSALVSIENKVYDYSLKDGEMFSVIPFTEKSVSDIVPVTVSKEGKVSFDITSFSYFALVVMKEKEEPIVVTETETETKTDRDTEETGTGNLSEEKTDDVSVLSETDPLAEDDGETESSVSEIETEPVRGSEKVAKAVGVLPSGDYVSRTPNVNLYGEKQTSYSHNMNMTEVVTVPGARGLSVTIEYGGESTSYDWACMWVGSHSNYTAGSNYGSSLTGKLGGTHGTQTYTVDGDTVTFAFRSDGSGVGDGFGYYAVVSSLTTHNEDYPAYHLEEKEDGTYRLVFDSAGNLERFTSNEYVLDDIGDKFDQISEIKMHRMQEEIGNGAFKYLSALETVTIPKNSSLERIGSEAFGNTAIRSLSIPNTVTELAENVFGKMSSLEELVFEEGSPITELPDHVFQGLGHLESVTLPENLTALPDRAFAGCVSLQEVELPDTVTSIGASAFEGCSSLMAAPLNEHITSVGNAAFKNCTSLVSVMVPESVETMGSDLFFGCTRLMTAVFNNSAERLPNNLLNGCSSLVNVRLPDNLTEIPPGMFSGCSSLVEVDMPDTVTTIGNSAFYNCTNLSNPVFSENIKKIGSNAFYGCNSITRLSIPNTITTIDTAAFRNCNNLQTVLFEDGCPMTSLPAYIFADCKKLKNVVLPENLQAVPDYGFYNCVALENVTLPTTVKSINQYAFSGCSKLEDIDLTNIKTIGGYAFYACKSLTDVVIPNTVTSIGNDVFYNCTGLRSLEFEEGSPLTTIGSYMCYGCTSLQTVVLPERLTSVPSYTFYNCQALQHVEYPDTIRTFGDYAFYNCFNLEDFHITNACTTIGSYTFDGCRKLEEIMIPNSVTSIGNYAFAYCNNLETVEFEPRTKSISVNTYAFAYDSKLENLTLPNHQATISGYTFYNDLKLTDVVIPGDVTQINNYAFYNCPELKSISFEESSKNITLNANAFGNLSGLEMINIDRNLTSVNAGAFVSLGEDTVYHFGIHVDTVPKELVSLWTDNTNVSFDGENDFIVTGPNTSKDLKWSNFVGKFYADSDGVVYQLYDNGTAAVFHVPDTLTSLHIPETVTSCAGVTYQVTSILPYACRDADSLTTVTADTPENITINQHAFYGCDTLETVGGEDRITANHWKFVSMLCGFPVRGVEAEQVREIASDIPFTDPTYEGTPAFHFGVLLTPGPQGMTDDTFEYLTGQSAQTTFLVSNQSNLDMSNQAVRIYFDFSGKNYNVGSYAIGRNYVLVNDTNGHQYPLSVVQTDIPGVFYYEVTGFQPGDTLTFRNSFSYLTPSSGGGTMKVWAVSMPTEEAVTYNGKVIDPEKYILANWTTRPVPYVLSKYAGDASTYVYTADGTADSDIYVKNLYYRISQNSTGDTSTTEGKDYIKYVSYTDELQLPDNLMWNPAFVTAIKNGDFRVERNSTSYIYVTVDGKEYQLASLQVPNVNYLQNVWPVVVEEDGKERIDIKWLYRNATWNGSSYPTADLPACTFYMRVFERSVCVVRDSDLWDALHGNTEATTEEINTMSVIGNKAKETRAYSYSGPQSSEALAPTKIVAAPQGFSMTKTYNVPSGSYFGCPYNFTINLENTGLVARTDLSNIDDRLDMYYYLTPENMDTMFKHVQYGAGLKLTLTPATLCLPSTTEVLDVYGDSIDGFVPQQRGVEPIPYNGCAPANSDASEITRDARIELEWNENHTGYVMEVWNHNTTPLGEPDRMIPIGETELCKTIRSALDSIGYVVTYRVQYDVHWSLPEGFKLYGGQKTSFAIPANYKDTHMLLEQDEVGHYHSSSLNRANTAYAKDGENHQVALATSGSTYMYRELFLSKSAVSNGVSYPNSENGNTVEEGSVIQYSLTLTNSGVEKDVLPLTDKMSGTQMLLIPCKGNDTATWTPAGSSETVLLKDSDVEIYNYNDSPYYLMNQPGSCRNVKISGKIADEVLVSTSSGNIVTQMFWYYQDVGAETNKVSYYALADATKAGAAFQDQNGHAIMRHSLQNESWLGGHQTHRLYASLGLTANAARFSKWICEDHAGRETLSRHSLIQEGSTVRYKMLIENTADSPMLLNGSQMYDDLPSTTNKFAWTKDNVTDISYVTEHNGEPLGSRCDTTDGSYWHVDAIQPNTNANTASVGQYYIHWHSDFNILLEPHGQIWIYVTCQYPDNADSDGDGDSDSVWNEYIAQNNGSIIYNSFYIDNRQSTVSHELVDVVRGYLQKGVVDVGNTNSSNYFRSIGTRYYYENGSDAVPSEPSVVSEVVYYATVYNNGNVRLYLDTLQDRLPKGFYFRGLANYCDSSIVSSGKGTASTTSSVYGNRGIGTYTRYTSLYTEYYGSNRASVIKDDNSSTVHYKDALITAETVAGVDGYDQIHFTIGRGYNNNSNSVKYDSVEGKYYLDPGEAIRFAYNVGVKGYKKTEDYATNTISMPVYDKYGLGVEISDGVHAEAVAMHEMAGNEGGCEKISTDIAVQQLGHLQGNAKKNTEWFTSNVSLMRQMAVPGIRKYVGGISQISATQTIYPYSILGSKSSDGNLFGNKYDSTALISDIVNWRIRVYNEGGIGTNSLEDYKVEDTVESPYQFTGEVFYNLYETSGSRVTPSSVSLFSIGARQTGSDTVRIYETNSPSSGTSYHTLTINGSEVSLRDGKVFVKIERDSNGHEKMTVRLVANDYRIPNGQYMELCYHTSYGTNDSVLSHTYYNDAELVPSQTFDPSMVAQGRVVYDEDDNPVAIQSGASVTITAGYSTSARKQVTEIAHPSNTGWSDRAENSIELPGKYSTFRYDLYVDLPEDDPTSHLYLIDSLPEEGDHSPFVDRDARESEFKVKMLGSSLGLEVACIAQGGTGTKTILQPDQYSFWVNTKSSFLSDDWTGGGTGWELLDLTDGLSEEEQAKVDAARSFRILIADSSLQLMKKNTQVKVTFNAELADPENTDPGTIAWNSFGYRYTVPVGTSGDAVSLNAEPLKVGVSIPGVPVLKKDLRTPADHTKVTLIPRDYRFVIYRGQAIQSLNDTIGRDDGAIADILTAENRIFTFVSLTVPANGSVAESGYLDELMRYEFHDGNWTETADHWVWEKNQKYTVLELPQDEEFMFASMSRAPINNYTFTQNSATNIRLNAINHYAKKGHLAIRKTTQGLYPDRTKLFTFTVHLEDQGYPVYGSFEYEGTGGAPSGTLVFNSEGNAVVSLADGQSVIIKNIPEGYIYRVTESADAVYDSQGTDTTGIIPYDETVTAAFVNTRAVTTLDLTKIVTGNMGDKTKSFDFTVLLSDNGVPVTGTFDVEIDRDAGATENTSVTFNEDGVGHISITHGDHAKIKGLPVAASYEVDEANYRSEGYRVYDASNESGILGRSPSNVSYTNIKTIAVPTHRTITAFGAFLVLLSLLGLCFPSVWKKWRKMV